MHCPSGVRTNLDIGEDVDDVDSHSSVSLGVPSTREINLIPSRWPSKNDVGEISWLSSGELVISVSLLGSACGRIYRWAGWELRTPGGVCKSVEFLSKVGGIRSIFCEKGVDSV